MPAIVDRPAWPAKSNRRKTLRAFVAWIPGSDPVFGDPHPGQSLRRDVADMVRQRACGFPRRSLGEIPGIVTGGRCPAIVAVIPSVQPAIHAPLQIEARLKGLDVQFPRPA